MSQSEALLEEGKIFLGKSKAGPECLELKLANRHGLVTGATGTGKTVTLQVLAEGFSRRRRAGVRRRRQGRPVRHLGQGEAKDGLASAPRRSASTTGPDTRSRSIFWDLFGEQGHPIRATVSEMGPLLLSRLMDLNETQEGVLNIAFQVADDEKLPLLDLKDLQALLQRRRRARRATHDQIRQRRRRRRSARSSAACSCCEQQGGEHFFGEPALDISDLMRTDARRARL